MLRSIFIFSICLLMGCSNSPSGVTNNNNEGLGQELLLSSQLQKAFSYWQGTPFRLGGDNKKGIDCSALVQNIYHDSFNVRLPRTTDKQVQKGFVVSRDQLQVGDLLFFKTSWNVRHVGIYIGHNKFIHASTSKGVITSSLDNSYWKSRYWQAKRILD